MDQVIQSIANGLMAGAIYGLIAVALALVFGVLDVPQFAMGDSNTFSVVLRADGTINISYPRQVDSPDNIVVTPRGGILICEDDASSANIGQNDTSRFFGEKSPWTRARASRLQEWIRSANASSRPGCLVAVNR